MATMNTADIGFEREIWKAADKMRGNIDASLKDLMSILYMDSILRRIFV